MSVAADSPSPSLLREAEESVVPLVELCCEEAQQQNEVDANCRHQEHQMSAQQQQNGRRMAAPQFVSWLCLRRARRARCRRTEERQFESASYLQMMRYANKWDWLLLVVGTTTALVCTAISTAAGSLISRGITDVLMEGQNYYVNGTLDMEHFYAGMIHHVLEFCVLGIFTLLSTQMSLACFAVLCERQIHRIRCALFQALMAQEPAWFDRSANQVGALTQKMSAGLDRIRAGMSDKLANILSSCSACSAGIAIGAYMSWKMALIMMGTFPFVALVFWGTTRSASSAIRKEMAANAAAGAVADEVLGGIRTVTAFNAQHAELARYKMHLESSQQIGIRKSLVMAFFAGLLLFVMFARLSVALWYGTTLVLQGDISPGTVFACYWAVAIGTMRIVQAFPQFSVVVGAKLAAGEIFSIIDRKPALDLTGPSGVRPSSVRGRIELCNVHFAYPTRPEIRVLNNVTLTIEAGESIALVGHSGCGKSTLVGLLMRFYCPTQGFITLDGVPIQELNVQWLREQVGLVQQEPVLFAGTVEENLRMGRENVTRQEMVAACRMANAHDFIQKLPNGYKTLVGQGGIQLSGGQKQRVAIARTLVRNPRILLLDEATSALDAESEQLVQEAIEQASAGRTTITIAHRLSTVRNADRICVFEHGRFVECGSHDELMARPESTYRRLVLAQQIEQERPSAIQDDDEFFATAAECEPNASEGGVPEVGLGDSSPSERTAASPLASQRIRRRPSAAPSSAAGNAEGDQEKPIHPYDSDDELDTRPASVGDILRYARPEMCMIVFGVLLALIRGASSPLFTVIYGRLFLVLSDSLGAEPAAAAASTQQQRDTLRSATIVYALAIVGVGLMSGLATFGSGALLGIVGEKLTQRLRLEVFRNILAQDGYFFDRPRYAPGKLTVRLATDAPNVQAAIDQRLAELLQGIVSLVACVSIAFYFGWNVAPIGLMVAVVLVLLQVGTTNYLKRRGMRDMQATEDTNRVATESLEYVRTVQALNRQQNTCRRFSESAKRPHTLAITRGLWTSLSMALTNSFVPLSFGVIYFLGLLLIQHGHTTPFILFQVVEALNGASHTFMAASAYYPEYLRAKISAGLMFAMARLRPRIDNLSEAGLEQPISGRISINSVHFAYPNAKKCLALNGLSLEVAAGTRVALVGPSGCGKSTLMQLLERIYDPTRGQLCVDGVDTCRYNVRHLRRNMALVGQEPTLFNMSIRDNIGYGLARHECPEERIQWAARLANIHAFVESLPLGYNTPVGARGTQLSGGQKQRIAIARAIVRDPRILLLDEATSALDTESEKAVQEALDRASEGRTSVVIAHRLSTIQSADLIVVVRDGRVIELGTHQELLRARGLYYRLVQRQSGAQ